MNPNLNFFFGGGGDGWRAGELELVNFFTKYPSLKKKIFSFFFFFLGGGGGGGLEGRWMYKLNI